jgi:FKBP-type peptidyl-prolyl cis-trans isomerase SlyD
MKADANRVVSIIYELRDGNANGEIVESLDYDRPLTFIMGKGNLLPKFEDQLTGLQAGEKFSFLLQSNDAYGPVQEAAFVEIPINIFEIDGKLDTNLLQLGNVVPMMDQEGRHLNGVVKNIGNDKVSMDFNHPMAGRDLYFSGEVTNVREASEEELAHGHIHAESTCGECGQDCNDKSAEECCGSDSECGCC